MSKQSKIKRANVCLVILKKYGECGKGSLPRAMCAYQVLHYHPERDHLISGFGMPGKGGGSHFSSAHWIMRDLMLLAHFGLVKYHYVTSKGSAFVVGNHIIVPSFPVMAFYQLTSLGMATSELKLENGKVILIDKDGNPAREFSDDGADSEKVED